MLFVLDALVNARRTRDAIKQIQELPVGDSQKKQILGAWFDEHEGVFRNLTIEDQISVRFNGYNALLGRERNMRLIG